MKNNKINIFFACDDNYIPFLGVTLESIRANSALNRDYEIHILNSGLKEENITSISSAFSSKNFKINFHNISQELEEFNERLHTRDYYSKSTYYRLFIPTLFPSLKKALYLDCDIVLRGDVAKLYDIELEDNLVAGVHDSFVDTHEAMKMYVENRVGVKPYTNYFNAGVLLMNLTELRKFNFKDKFLNLLSSVKFNVAQDQDYLNALCKDRVKKIDWTWNFMPLENTVKDDKIQLIHFNLDYKPWQKEGILYSDLFWRNAEKTFFLEKIKGCKTAFNKAYVEKAKLQTENLITLCFAQGSDEKENCKIQKIINNIKEAK